jgi:hypothetical protein
MSARHTVWRKIYTTAKYKFGFVTAVLDPADMTPSAKFTQEITAALGKSTNAEKREALKVVFERFGHSYQTEVTLGGLLVSTDTTTTSGAVSRNFCKLEHLVSTSLFTMAQDAQEKFENEVKAKLAYTSGAEVYSAKGAAAGGWGKDAIDKAMDQSQKIAITAKVTPLHSVHHSRLKFGAVGRQSFAG